MQRYGRISLLTWTIRTHQIKRVSEYTSRIQEVERDFSSQIIKLRKTDKLDILTKVTS